jgi:hypothetical protein
MGFYNDIVLPRLIDLAMRKEDLVSYRQRVIGAAQGRVLEIGIGSGLSLPFYGTQVTEVGLDPFQALIDMARPRAGADRNEHFNPAVVEYRGRIVKMMRDGALVEFDSAIDDVECAIAIQRALANPNSAHPEANAGGLGIWVCCSFRTRSCASTSRTCCRTRSRGSLFSCVIVLYVFRLQPHLSNEPVRPGPDGSPRIAWL